MEYKIPAESLAAIVESMITGVCVFSLNEKRQLIPVHINDGMYRMLGYSKPEFERMIRDVRLSIIPDDLPIFEQGINDVLKDDGAVEIEFRTVTSDGAIRWLQVRANLYGKLDGYPLFAMTVIDATERKSIEEELALQAERLNILSESTKEHLLDYNSRTDVLNLRLDKSAFQKGEIVVKDFMQKGPWEAIHPEDCASFTEVINAARKKPLSDIVEFRSNYFEDGNDNYLWYRATLTSVRGADGYVSRIVGRIVNIELEKKKELELKIKADKDSLTGLYNKGAATTLITEAIEKCAADGSLAALMMFDLDHFKSVNDTFGHAVGDKVIAGAGKILNDTFKGRDIVGRMGGDEFMVFMADIKSPDDALGIAKRLNKDLTKKIENSEGKVVVTASIGIAMFDPSKGVPEYETLYEQADKALYATKESGRNGRTLFSENMETIR